MTPNQKGKRLGLAALALAALLSACHHHDDDNGGSSSMPPPVANNPPPTMTDAFFSYVSQLVSTQSDTAEPVSTDGVTVTTPEDTEPQPLPGP
jgi:hypothetical protein